MLKGEEPMPAVFRPRRSLLYMPGSNSRALEKARGLPADGLILDLEDAVAPEAKESARTIVAAALAARAYGLAILDGVHLDLADDEGFALSCRQGRELGFDGKTLIHPKQIAQANTAFAPSASEVQWSRRIIAAYAEAEAAGRGVVLVDGKLIEALHVENARRLVALAEEIDRLASVDTPRHAV